jgi:hypothetical protein
MSKMKTIINKPRHGASMKKQGQIGVYVLIALGIVLVVFVIALYPRLRGGNIEQVQDPTSFLTTCLEPSFRNTLNTLFAHGGYRTPQGFLVYQDEQIEYLCYTSENYKPCVVQQPLIKEHVEEELTAALQEPVRTCMQQLQEAYERQGYRASIGAGKGPALEVIPGKVLVTLDLPLTLTKEGTRTFRTFQLSYPSELYDLAYIVTSIIEFEATLGGSETTTYIQYYPDLKIKKLRLGDGSTLYDVEHVVSKEKFRFATRSLVFPPGYGFAR